MRGIAIVLSVLSLFVGALVGLGTSSARAAQPAAVTKTFTVYGDVRDARNKTPTTPVPAGLPPVVGAAISVAALGVNIQTDQRGHFEQTLTVTLTPQGAATYQKVAASVSATGFGAWSISGLPAYVSSSGMRLYIELTAQSQSRT